MTSNLPSSLKLGILSSTVGESERLLLASVELRLGSIAHLVDYLEYKGHHVVRFVDSVSEVEKVLASGSDFSVAVINDPLLNGEDGEVAGNLIRDKRPKARIIAVSYEPQDWADLTLRSLPTEGEVLQAVESV